MRTAAGWVLVGGQSKRMGRDKALLPVGGGTLAESVAAIVAQVAKPVTLVGHPERYAGLGYPVVADDQPDNGPLGGIQTALRTSGADWNLILACDLIRVDVQLLERLLAFEPSARCVILDGQPLCGVYHRDCLPAVNAAIAAKRLRVRDLADSLEASRLIPTNPDKLMNLNTLDDWNQYVAGLDTIPAAGQ